MKTKSSQNIARYLALLLLMLALCATSSAQEPWHPTFQFGGGVSPTISAISSRLTTGGHLTAGIGLNFSRSFDTTINYTYHALGVSKAVLDEIQVPDANAHLWSITLDPKIRIPTGIPFVPYLVGGVGYYRRTVEFTQPTIASVTVFDPFFDIFYSVPIVADQVLGKITRSGMGGSLGAGFEIKLGGNPRFFGEARYEYADTGRVPTRMVPFTVGFRW
jgi:opacity protein-like surface antigen